MAGTWYTAAVKDVITSAHFNQNTVQAFTGVAGYEVPITLAHNIAGTLLMLPTTDPGSPVELFQVKQQLSSNRMAAIRSDGKIISAATINGALTLQPNTTDVLGSTELFQILLVAGTRELGLRADGGIIQVSGAVATLGALFTQGVATLGSSLDVVGRLNPGAGILMASGVATLNNLTVPGNINFVNFLATGVASLPQTNFSGLLTAGSGIVTPSGAVATLGVLVAQGLSTFNGRIVANTVGVSGKPLLNFIPLSAPYAQTSFTATETPTLQTITGLPASATAALVMVNSGVATAGSANLRVASDASTTFSHIAMQLSITTSSGVTQTAIVPITTTSQISFGFASSIGQTAAVTVSLIGYFEPA